ncbi:MULTISPECIES: hypothetical protein [Alicyclobacillus]|uniref:Uncharacterized protein n=1 Tax=Alicyclobacillus acidocaldarius subsp. acidocaldarius (strain ATCC 27009 / DSM 446 / BCRC 14685 / JCM 5260 / KCTC 1825 / NBRC 15652 / NCIMB 11725 / NRRL B-14509 / 104-IA) TaxID=521098 RepID=C8WVK9_ALIAD|nr:MULTISPECIES: hypothetical protein [Alicyclobacillus]ACV58131.1 hypothetical protein Aaci_1095 [Alicyclobacillus acidocaldarius subsp. acidocaldarius DSM 446]MCL6489906.1 hypothetical protein [Alicyclobacillus mali (ex Roth et al. 2021)]
MNERLTLLSSQLQQAGERVARAKALWLVNSSSDHANQLYERYRAEQAYLAHLLDELFRSKDPQAS